MKVAILTMFTGLSPTYSLVNVVSDQLRMLLSAGIPVKVLVAETCPDGERTGVFADPRIQWVKIVNTAGGRPFVWHDYSGASGPVHGTFYEEAARIAQDYVNSLQDVDICLLHDILYQGWHLVHNIALRRAQMELPGVRFLSFTHSLPVPRPGAMAAPFSARFLPMPNTRFVYPTRSGIPALARQYGVSEEDCAVVNNALPLADALGPDAARAAEAAGLLDAEIGIVYPARLTPGKQPQKVAALAGALRRETGKDVRLLFCDFPCADIDPGIYKSVIRMEGQRFGLPANGLSFTTDLGYPDGFPRQGVLGLFTLTNLFICPSRSESFGLTVLEAASRGNFLVLNEAVPALQELGGTLGAYFLRWDARNFDCDTHETYHPSEEAYYAEHSRRIADAMDHDPALHAKTVVRRRYSLRWIFEHQLLPLLQP